MNILERFLKYVSFDTQSAEESNTFPSTLKQHKLADYLVEELKSLGVDNAFKDEHSYVYAKIPGKINKSIGLIAHLDTALEIKGDDVKPNIIKDYDGNDIILANGIEISTKDYPFLNSLVNHQLITTDGNTLLGADDKAGIAIIMSVVEKVLSTNDLYPTIYIAFTPDEEVGNGTLYFNYDYFKVDFAYTIDGGPINYINYENFNAASASVKINGKSIHPGSAKNKMVNSLMVAMEFDRLLPEKSRPEFTEGYEGFNHLNDMNGGVNETNMNYIIRNHDFNLFEQQKSDFVNAMNYLNNKYGYQVVELGIVDSYRNMKELILPHQEILDYPIQALKSFNLQPVMEPIRGGTDGARLSYEGVLCPNLGTGSYNHHGPMEIADITDMTKMVEIITHMLSIIK